ncbi:MAG: tetratricopeptide repeat protein [Oceanicaulis sp.]
MVDVFDEVEEELRRERYQALLRQWGPWVGGVAVAIVLGVAGYQFIDWRSETTAAGASDRYMAASDLIAEGDLAAADAALAGLAEDGPRGYAALALLRRGEIALEQGDADEAARLFTAAAERAPEPLTRDLARYKAALAQFDTLSYDDLSVRLEPLSEGEARFGLLAGELIAAAALRDERWAQARSRYELLSVALDAPPGLSRRAAEALAFIEQNAPQTADDAAPAETAPAAPAQAEPQIEEDGR